MLAKGEMAVASGGRDLDAQVVVGPRPVVIILHFDVCTIDTERDNPIKSTPSTIRIP
jgi:hypothetical protein